MKKEDKNRNSMENSVSALEADMKKAHLVSSIMEKAELGDEEENKGRS